MMLSAHIFVRRDGLCNENGGHLEEKNILSQTVSFVFGKIALLGTFI